MALAENVPLGPESKFVLNGIPYNYVEGTATVVRDSHPIDDDTNANWHKSKAGRRILNVSVSAMAERTREPVSQYDVMTATEFIELIIEPFGTGEGGAIECAEFEPTQLEFRMPAGQGGPVMVSIQGHSSGDVIFS